jgi:intracellular sulfur oxidation DsrE/DsrF family protein
MLTRCIPAFLIYLLSIPLFAAEPTTGPIIDRDVPLVKDHVYRVVYEITAYDGSPDSVNRELDVVARFLNMHGKNGVPPENLQLAVVIHGPALVNVLNDDSYRERLQMSNPNLDLVQKLLTAGVRFYACGQAMGFRGFDKSELVTGVKMALSAMTMVHQLQADGYTMQP